MEELTEVETSGYHQPRVYWAMRGKRKIFEGGLGAGRCRLFAVAADELAWLIIII